MKQYQHIMGTINYWIFLVLIFMLPYHNSCIRPLWVAWLIGWLIELRWIRKPQLSKQRIIEMLPVLGLVCIMLWEALSASWAAEPALSGAMIGRHINFAAVLVISIFGVNEQYKASTILKTLIATSVISVGFYLMTHFWLDNIRAAISKEWAPDHMLDWRYMENLTYALKHRLHYATLLTMSLVSIIFLAKEEIKRHEPWKVYVLSTVAGIILLAGIYWSGSRENMVNVVAIFSLWAIWHTPGRWKIATAAGLIVLALTLGWTALRFYPRFAGQGLEQVLAYDETAERPAFEPRIAIWHAALEQPSDYLAYGLGAGNCTNYMVERYTEKGWQHYIERAFSPHNQYLTICMELGIVAAILFLLIWLSLPFCHKGRARQLALYITAILMLNMMTDMFLGVIEGILLTCILLLIIHMLDREGERNSLAEGIQAD